MKHTYAYCLFLIFLLAQLSHAQSLTEARQKGVFAYIFKINNEQAERLVKTDEDDYADIREQDLHTLVDSFPADSIYRKPLRLGHYLEMRVESTSLKFQLISINNTDIQVINNSRDFSLLILDTLNQAVSNAEVRLEQKHIPFNKHTQTYFLSRNNKKGILAVHYQGHTSFFEIQRDRNNLWIKRAYNYLIFKTPLRIAYRYTYYPISNLVRDIRYGNFFYNIGRRFERLFEKKKKNQLREGNKHTGYLVFNKPKYLPRDTVKMKAFIVRSRSGKPYNHPLKIYFISNYDYKRQLLKEISPTDKGEFIFELPLKDSLKVDTYYNIEFADHKNKTLIKNHFRIEDYQLNETSYKVKPLKEKYFGNEAVILIASGQDANGLALMDARVALKIEIDHVNQYFEDKIFLKRTLWETEMPLEPLGETKIVVPDSLLSWGAEVRYRVHANFNNSNNEKHDTTFVFNYLGIKERVEVKLEKGVIKANVVREDSDKSGAKGKLSIDLNDNRSVEKEITFPFSEKVNPFAQSYYFALKKNISNSYDFPKEEAGVQGGIFYDEAKNIKAQIINNHAIPIWYSIFFNQKLIAQGQTSDTLFIWSELTSRNPDVGYSLSVQYIWGGEVENKEYSTKLNENRLVIETKQPAVVFPSQKTEIEVSVKDYRGKPVKNANLTAYSVNHQFNKKDLMGYSPRLPYLGNNTYYRSSFNSFQQGGRQTSIIGAENLYNFKMKHTLLADTLLFYKFLYPENQIFIHYEPAEVSQFAPFIFSNGYSKPIVMLYLDNQLVYYSDTDLVNEYSFPATAGYHHLRMRTNFDEYEIDSLLIKPNQKLFLSFDTQIIKKNTNKVKHTKKSNEFTKEELAVLKDNLLIVNRFDLFKNQENFMLKKDTLYFDVAKITHYSYYPYPRKRRLQDRVILGVMPHYQEVDLLVKNDFSRKIKHESGYYYFFKSNNEMKDSLMKTADFLLMYRYQDVFFDKMPIKDIRDFIGKKLPTLYPTALPLSDKVLTAKDLIPKEIIKEEDPLFYYKAKSSVPNPNFYTAIHKSVYSFEIQGKTIITHLFMKKYAKSTFTDAYQISNHNKINGLSAGMYRCLFLSSKNELYIKDSIKIGTDSITFERFGLENLKKVTDIAEIITLIDEKTVENQTSQYAPSKVERQITVRRTGKYTIRGRVISEEDNSGLPGVSVVVKGSNYGTITDIDGNYELFVNEQNAILLFSYVGYVYQEAPVTSSVVNAKLFPDTKQLSEVVVVGYAAQMKRELTGAISAINIDGSPTVRSQASDLSQAMQGKAAGVIRIRGAASLYGSRAISEDDLNKLLGIETIGNFNEVNDLQNMPNTMRRNFRDYGYWQPHLKTDKNGKAKFEVSFPDNVTAWNTYILAMNSKQQSGFHTGQIKAFKPIMANLSTPRFLLEGDSTFLIGKILNYTEDTVEVQANFDIGVQKDESSFKVVHSQIQKKQIVADQKDSLTTSFSFKYKDYFDGEERKIPVYPVGMEKSIGQFMVLEKDTTLTIDLPKGTQVSAFGTPLRWLLTELDEIKYYPHECNEQLASKLTAFLMEKQVRFVLKEPFKHEKDILRIIEKLKDRQKSEGTWGWFADSPTNEWMTVKVMQALHLAETEGYKIPSLEKAIDVTNTLLIEKSLHPIEQVWEGYTYLDLLGVLSAMKVKINYEAFLSKLEAVKFEKDLHTKLKILKIKTENGLVNEAVTNLMSFKKETLFGAYYFGEENYHWYDNSIQNTLLAYQILKAANASQEILQKLRYYFFEQRRKSSWRNTHEAVAILLAILPDMLEGTDPKSDQLLKLSGAINEEIKATEKPFTTTISENGKLTIKKIGSNPIYFATMQKTWIRPSTRMGEDFEVMTTFWQEEKPVTTFQSGKSLTMQVRIEVKKKGDYAMIEIPIPAGCTYQNHSSVRTYSSAESHREYLRDKLCIFLEKVEARTYTFAIPLQVRYEGTYTVNPAKIELMYFPIFNGYEAVKKVRIE